jgi:hypothetical protein
LVEQRGDALGKSREREERDRNRGDGDDSEQPRDEHAHESSRAIDLDAARERRDEPDDADDDEEVGADLAERREEAERRGLLHASGPGERAELRNVEERREAGDLSERDALGRAGSDRRRRGARAARDDVLLDLVRSACDAEAARGPVVEEERPQARIAFGCTFRRASRHREILRARIVASLPARSTGAAQSPRDHSFLWLLSVAPSIL